jgi:hypothetical protein
MEVGAYSHISNTEAHYDIIWEKKDYHKLRNNDTYHLRHCSNSAHSLHEIEHNPLSNNDTLSTPLIERMKKWGKNIKKMEKS